MGLRVAEKSGWAAACRGLAAACQDRHRPATDVCHIVPGGTDGTYTRCFPFHRHRYRRSGNDNDRHARSGRKGKMMKVLSKRALAVGVASVAAIVGTALPASAASDHGVSGTVYSPCSGNIW